MTFDLKWPWPHDIEDDLRWPYLRSSPSSFHMWSMMRITCSVNISWRRSENEDIINYCTTCWIFRRKDKKYICILNNSVTMKCYRLLKFTWRDRRTEMGRDTGRATGWETGREMGRRTGDRTEQRDIRHWGWLTMKIPFCRTMCQKN